MTDIELNNEFSREFDVLYNNITSNQAPGLDEYEKSIFLTRAQNEIVKAYFSDRSNKVQEGYDKSEQRQIDFSMITVSKNYETFGTPAFSTKTNSKSVVLDKDIMMILNEIAVVKRDNIDTDLIVVPIDYSSYSLFLNKPFKYPLKNQAWRLFNSSPNSQAIELIVGPNDKLNKYIIRYVKKPRAIRLIEFDEDLTIEGGNTLQSCELDPILHPDIIQRACELAKAAYTGDLASQLALGQSSQTKIGIIAQNG